MKLFAKFITTTVICGLFLPVMAQAQEPGTDSPYIGRIPGYIIYEYKQQFDRMSPWNADWQEMDPVMGTYTEIQYRAEEGARQSALAISMVYTGTFQSMGAEILGSGDKWGSYLLRVDGKNVYINLRIWNDGDSYYLYILEEGGLNLQLTPSTGAATPSNVPAQELTPPSGKTGGQPATGVGPASDLGMSEADLAMLAMLLGGGSGDCNLLGKLMEFGLLAEQMTVNNHARMVELEPQLTAFAAEMEAMGDEMFTDPVKSAQVCQRVSDFIVLMQQ